MMVHHLLQVLHITVILLLVLLKTSYVDMQLKLDIMFLEDLVGIVMDYQLNTKSINNLKLQIKDKFYKWELKNIIHIVEASSWNIQIYGKVLSIDLVDGLISKMIIKHLISNSCNQSGMYLNNFSKKDLFIEEEKSCLILMPVLQSYQILKFNLTIKM